MNNSQGKRKSTFIASETILAGAYFDFWTGSVNYCISSANFMSQLGVTGTLVQLGDVTAVPILDVQGTVNRIRNIETAAGSGLQAEVSVTEGCSLSLDAQSTGEGLAILNTSNKIRRLLAGANITLSLDGDDITIESTPGTAATSQTTGITAYAGGGQANAVELTTRYNIVGTVATIGDSLKLPAGVPGTERFVANDGANTLDLFPASSGNINGNGVNVAITIAAGARAALYCYSATAWTLLYNA